MSSTKALSCTFSNWQGEDCLHGKVLNTKNFVLCRYPSLTVQEVVISKDGEKRWVITWSTKSEWDDIGSVKARVFLQGSVENLAATRPDLLFRLEYT